MINGNDLIEVLLGEKYIEPSNLYEEGRNRMVDKTIKLIRDMQNGDFKMDRGDY